MGFFCDYILFVAREYRIGIPHSSSSSFKRKIHLLTPWVSCKFKPKSTVDLVRNELKCHFLSPVELDIEGGCSKACNCKRSEARILSRIQESGLHVA